MEHSSGQLHSLPHKNDQSVYLIRKYFATFNLKKLQCFEICSFPPYWKWWDSTIVVETCAKWKVKIYNMLRKPSTRTSHTFHSFHLDILNYLPPTHSGTTGTFGRVVVIIVVYRLSTCGIFCSFKNGCFLHFFEVEIFTRSWKIF